MILEIIKKIKNIMAYKEQIVEKILFIPKSF